MLYIYVTPGEAGVNDEIPQSMIISVVSPYGMIIADVESKGPVRQILLLEMALFDHERH